MVITVLGLITCTKEQTLVNMTTDPDDYIKQEAQRATYREPEYNVPPFWGIRQGGHFYLLVSPKNTNLEEDVEVLLPVKCR